MGLAERRASKEFETKRFPQFKKDIVEAAGFDVPIEVSWDQLQVEEQAHLYDECWGKVYFEPLVQAFKSITADDMGKEALKGALTKVQVVNSGNVSYADYCASFEQGVLRIDHQPTTNVDDIDQRAKAIQKLLESKL